MMRWTSTVLLALGAIVGCGASDSANTPAAASMAHCYQIWSEYGEPTLCAANGPEERVYRFVWERSFHELAMVRVQEQPDGTWSVHTKLLARESPSTPLLLTINEERVVPATEIGSLTALLAMDSEFWDMPSELDRIPAVDGSSWIIEARGGSTYHYVNRQSPAEGEFVRQLGLAFIELSGHDFSTIY